MRDRRRSGVTSLIPPSEERASSLAPSATRRGFLGVAGGAALLCSIGGRNESISARLREDNHGRWLYHCHVFTHQDAGVAGWYLVEP